MYLDELIDLIGTLNSRIEKHRSVLSRNEAATRNSLIDPLLAALGWDIADPAEVEPEYQSGAARRADYALKGGAGIPSIIVEAKKLGRQVDDGIGQSIAYCLERGIEFFVVTNGEKWVVYEMLKRGPIEDKLIVEFRVSDVSNRTVMKMLWLWRGNFKFRHPEQPTLPEETPSKRKMEDGPSEIPRQAIAFDKYAPSPGQNPPKSIIFPDGTQKSINKWFEIQTFVVTWLIESGRIAASDCPIASRAGAYLVHTEPVQQSGKRFRNAKNVAGLWIEASRSAQYHVRVAKWILEERQVPLHSFHVADLG